MSSEGRYYGKYRGVVLNNIDPMQMGRVQVQVPDVMGVGLSSWAMACVPFTGKQSGVYCVPQIGAGVWVEFEQGDPDFPIWVGCFWGSSSELPKLAQTVPPAINGITLQTMQQNGLVISDLPGPTGGILLQTTSGARISVSDVGIVISNGKGATINMNGPTVDINAGALTIV
jgi:uncharacterized protein involved in type VI secretion and phage assembly